MTFLMRGRKLCYKKSHLKQWIVSVINTFKKKGGEKLDQPNWDYSRSRLACFFRI